MLIALVKSEYLPATNEVELTTKCPVCSKFSRTIVKAKDFERWTEPNGPMIQEQDYIKNAVKWYKDTKF